MAELFGYAEIAEYAKTCTDPKVLAIIKRLSECRSKNAVWCNHVNDIKKKNRVLLSSLVDVNNALVSGNTNEALDIVIRVVGEHTNIINVKS